MADQTKYGNLNSPCTVIQTGHQVQTENQSVDTSSYLLEVPYPGVQRSRQPLHCQPQKPSTLLQHMLPNKSYGIDLYSMNSRSSNLRLQYYSWTIKLLSLYYTILNFMHIPNTLTLHIIFYMT